MNYKYIIAAVSALFIASVSIAVITNQNGAILKPNILSTSQASILQEPNTAVSVAEWGSKALSVEELMKEADLVVKAKAITTPVSRIVGFTQEKIEVRGDERKSAGSYVDKIIFSDTIFEIVQLYKGNAPKELTVVQTGGINPKDPNTVEQFSDDPIYKLGEEYILFLKDFSDPIVHGNRTVYFTLNPSGRYIVDGNTVRNYADSFVQKESKNLPQTVEDLEEQINASLTK